MWFFRKKQTLEESGFFRGFTDWHSHILPGVDDGVQTMEEALQLNIMAIENSKVIIFFFIITFLLRQQSLMCLIKQFAGARKN